MLGACDQAGEPDPTPVSSSSGPPDVDPCDALPDVSECLAKSSECSKRCDGCPPGGSICLPDEPDCAHDCAVAEQKCSDRYYECVQGDDSSG